MGLKHHPRVVTNGLVYYLDAANTRSYSGSGNTAYGLFGPNGTLTNGTGYTSANSGSFFFDGTDDSIDFSSYTPDANTVSIWVNLKSCFPQKHTFHRGKKQHDGRRRPLESILIKPVLYLKHPQEV